MPQQNQSGKVGTSSSPIVNRVLQNSAKPVAPVAVPGVLKSGQLNRQPVK